MTEGDTVTKWTRDTLVIRIDNNIKTYIHNILINLFTLSPYINQWKTIAAKPINANTKTTNFCPRVAQNVVDAVKKE